MNADGTASGPRRPRRVAVTGANGHVGSRVVRALRAADVDVRAIVRRLPSATSGAKNESGGEGASSIVAIGDIAGEVDWGEALDGVDVVVHLAGLAPVAGNAPVPAERHDAIDHRATGRLASAASLAGVDRFVFLSSTAVYGERGDVPVSEREPARPTRPYGASKLRAEAALRAIAGAGTMRVATLRAPMVHGPGCRGEVRWLAALARTGWPLPVGALRARRSVVGVDNLADLVRTLVLTGADVSGTWNVADDDDVTVAELLDALAHGIALARGDGAGRVRTFPVPEPLLRAAAGLLGRAEAVERLTASVRVDASAVRERFGWRPPRGTFEGLVEAGASFAHA